MLLLPPSFSKGSSNEGKTQSILVVNIGNLIEVVASRRFNGTARK